MGKNHISNKDETARMFESDILEALSKVHWTLPLYVFLPVIFYFLYKSIFVSSLEFVQIILMIILGLFAWTFIEYSLHRLVFHFEPSGEIGKRLHFMFYGVHNDYPNVSKRLVMPPSISIPLASIFFYLFYYILGPISIYPFFIGFIGGYFFYNILDYAIHHFNMKSIYWFFIKKHHLRHHYQHTDKGFGVSQPLWDYIFGTTFSEKRERLVFRLYLDNNFWNK